MKKRVFAFLLAAVFLLLTGCSDTEETISTKPAESIPTTEVITTLPTEQLHSEDWYAVHTLANLFAAEYFHGNRDILKANLADTFEGEVDVYYDYHSQEDVSPNIRAIKGLDSIGEMQIGDLCYPSIEFVSGLEGDDSYTYLSMVMIKQENGWKIQSYGLEK